MFQIQIINGYPNALFFKGVEIESILGFVEIFELKSVEQTYIALKAANYSLYSFGDKNPFFDPKKQITSQRDVNKIIAKIDAAYKFIYSELCKDMEQKIAIRFDEILDSLPIEDPLKNYHVPSGMYGVSQWN